MFRVVSPREADVNDSCRLVKLLCTCFNDACGLVNYACSDGLRGLFSRYPHYEPHLVFIAEEDGAIASTLHVLNRIIRLNGNAVRVGGVAGVCTDPRFRGRGLATGLLKYAVDALRGGYDALALFTTFGGAAYAIYRRVGFNDFYIREYGVASVIDLPKANYALAAVDEASDSDADALLNLYNKVTTNLDGPLVRTRDYVRDHLINATWLKLTRPGVNAKVVKLMSEGISAYALVTGVDNDGLLNVEELVAENCEPALSLVNQLVKDTGAKGVRVYAPLAMLRCLGARLFTMQSVYMLMNLEKIEIGNVRDRYIFRVDQW
jgi:GNAT superfamily N-acetyltransferase